MSSSSIDLNACYDLVMQLVSQSGEIVAARNSQRKTVQIKSHPTDFVTETDQQIEKLLIDGIRKKFPDHKFIGEEESSEGKKVQLTEAPTWIIDPIDGTMNFVHSFPHSAISIALLVNKVTEIGIVYNPVLEQKFTARRGQGAFYNGKRIHVSDETDITKALIMIEFGTNRESDKVKVVMENLNLLVRKCHGMRCLGGAVLNICMVALGGAECAFDFGAHAWDYAASEFIVREAGGVTLDPSGGNFDIMSRRLLVANNMEMANQLVAEIVQYYPSPRDDE
ncbi:CLUMA_CG015782, isoform A [Clunio marinus]|uniref:Inositol-1-monophosphatase n=1 Tax=Clunio marinus TaxID=568069 RepID=A0A1J1IUX3_9DIPT|nr:CLUMA_CG015782, isoform A [Clunio marinus]